MDPTIDAGVVWQGCRLSVRVVKIAAFAIIHHILSGHPAVIPRELQLVFKVLSHGVKTRVLCARKIQTVLRHLRLRLGLRLADDAIVHLALGLADLVPVTIHRLVRQGIDTATAVAKTPIKNVAQEHQRHHEAETQ